MFLRIRQILSVCIFSFLFALYAVSGATAHSITTWQPEVGDVLKVDVTTNTGYLTHTSDGLTMSFPVATGRKNWVYYIGRYYHAATPTQNWEVKKLDVLPDRYTFGPEGHFLRLFKDGEKRTSYGIHSIKYVDRMLARDDRYKSMGCIIVSEKLMDILEETYKNNGNSLMVKTFAS